MSKYILKIPKGLLSLLLIIAGALKSLFVIQMGYNVSVLNFSGYFNPGVSLFIITIIATGLVYSLAVRLVILIGYKIANRIYLGKSVPGVSPEERQRAINYVEFRSIAIGYITIAGFLSAILNIPMYLFPLSFMLCQIIAVYIEVTLLIIMAFDLMKYFEPKTCKRVVTALLIPFGIFIMLRVLAGV